jgi:hypothetical protein
VRLENGKWKMEIGERRLETPGSSRNVLDAASKSRFIARRDGAEHLASLGMTSSGQCVVPWVR